MWSNYNVSRDPSKNTIAGLSLGGLTAAFAGLRHPEVFGNVLSQSGSFWWKPRGEMEGEWLAKEFALRPKTALRFYLDVGLLEMGSNSGGTPQWVSGTTIPYGPSMMVVNRHMRDILKLKGYWMHYAEFSGGHNAAGWRGALADGLIALIGTGKGETSIRQ